MGCFPGRSARRPRGDRIAPPNSGAPSLVAVGASSGSAAHAAAPLLPSHAPAAAPVAGEISTAVAAPPPSNPGRDLVRALKQGDVANVAELIESSGELLERRGMWENTPLLVACHYGYAEMALMLLKRGADGAVTNEQGCTPLLFACVEAMEDVVTKLLERPSVAVDPPAAMVYSKRTDETSSRTPLQSAAETGSSSIVSMILARGATADPSALILAVGRGHTPVCVALLSALLPADGAPPEEAPAWLEEALSVSRTRGHDEITNALTHAYGGCGTAAPASTAQSADETRATKEERGEHVHVHEGHERAEESELPEQEAVHDAASHTFGAEDEDEAMPKAST
jgi:hypothetical protein